MTDEHAERLVRALEASGFAYELMDCDPEFADTEIFCERYGCDPQDCANTIVVKSKKGPEKFAACVVLATTRLDVNNVVRRKLGARKASFAAADETARMTGMILGGVTPFGLPPELPLWVDGAVMKRETVILGGSSRSLKLKISPQVFRELSGAEIVEDLARPVSP